MMDPTVYDSEIHQFIDPPKDPDPAHLAFYRWLVETGRLERDDTRSE